MRLDRSREDERLTTASASPHWSGPRWRLVVGWTAVPERPAEDFTLERLGSNVAQTSRSTLEDAVWKADAAWADASASNNVDRMLVFYDANATFIGTSPPTAGLDRLRALWTNFFGRPGYTLTWKAERVEASPSRSRCSIVGASYGSSVNDAAPAPAKARRTVLMGPSFAETEPTNSSGTTSNWWGACHVWWRGSRGGHDVVLRHVM